MILECACGKMYRVRDDAANPPTKCPVCGGILRAAGAPSPIPAADSRLKEAERERDEARARTAALERQLEEARSSSAEGAKLSSQVSELRATAEKADRLERELLALRSESERTIKDLERERLQAREAADREAAERRKIESRHGALEETHTRSLEGKQKTIDALDASVVSFRAKVDQLQKQLEKVDLQRLADLQGFENRMREREEKDRAELDQVGQNHLRDLTELREEMERKIADKDRQISEQRQLVDREAGERRRLNEVLTRLQETANREVREKEAALKAQETTLASFKGKADTLQKRVNDLEQLRRSDQDALAARQRTSQALRGRLEEAGHFASDLDHNMDGVDSLLSGLRERMRRLKETLVAPPEPEMPASSLGSGSLVPTAPPAEAPLAPALSQSAFEFAPSTPPAASPSPAPFPQEDGLEEVSKPESESLEEVSTSEAKAKIDPPSELNLPAIARPELQPEPEPEIELDPVPAFSPPEKEEAPPARDKEPEDVLPLISLPSEDDAAPSPPPSAAPPAKNDAPPRARFSWKRK